MEALEKEFLDIITNIKFRTVRDTFQMKLEKDIPKNSKNQFSKVFVFANKTSNIFEIHEQQHKELLHDNVTKT